MFDLRAFPRPAWTPVPRAGCRGVTHRVLLRDERCVLAMLRFEKDATIDEHAAPIDIDVVCLEGRGWTSVGGEVVALCEGHSLRWPAGVPHRLWTEDVTMVTLMVEHAASG